MTPTEIAHAVAQLSRTIPNPTPRKAKLQQSWAGCKLGQRLTNLKPIHTVQLGTVEAGGEWLVVATTSEWMELQLNTSTDDAILVWTNKEWRSMFKPLRARKVKGTPTNES